MLNTPPFGNFPQKYSLIKSLAEVSAQNQSSAETNSNKENSAEVSAR